MKWMWIVLFVAGFSSTHSAQDFRYWNDLTDAEKRQELAKSRTSESIVSFYFGERPAGDSISLDALLTRLSKADSSQRLFYFQVFIEKIPAYTDSLPINNLTVHVMNMLNYHAPYVLYYLSTYDDGTAQQMLKTYTTHAFDNMSWFFPPKAQFKSDIAHDLDAGQQQQLNKLLE